MNLRGSARCTGSSGLGDTAASIPAGGGSVREASSASRTVYRRWGAHGLAACTERVRAPGRPWPIWPKIDGGFPG